MAKNTKRQERRRARLVALSAALATTTAAHAVCLVGNSCPGTFGTLKLCQIEFGVFVPGYCLTSGYGGFLSNVVIADPYIGAGNTSHTDNFSTFGPAPADPTPRVSTRRSSSNFAASSTGQTTESDLNTPSVLYNQSLMSAEAQGESKQTFDAVWALNQPGVTVSGLDDDSDSGINDAPPPPAAAPPLPGAPATPDSAPPPNVESPIVINANYGGGDSTGTPKISVGEPINSATGNVYETQSDFVGLGPFPIRYVRSYNSLQQVAGFATTELGSGWRGSYDSAVTLLSAASSPTAVVTRPDGQSLVFTNPTGSQWVSFDPTVRAVLASQSDGNGNILSWTYVTADDYVESYNAAGRLLSIANRAGLTQTLAYNANAQLSSVTDPFGHQLLFAYNAQGLLVQATDPAGGVDQYSYDGSNNLVSVVYPDQSSRRYLYEDSAFPNALTGLIDENGSRLVTWTYDGQGRAIGSVLAGGVQPVSIAYNSDGSSNVTDARGTVRQHTFLIAATGALRPVSNSVTSCVAACPSISASLAYNSNGFASSSTDPNGNTTTVTYNSRGLLASRTEAAGTPLARTVAISWHPVFHLPTQITFPDRVVNFTYDNQGNRLAKAVTAGGVTRQWTYAYNTQGLLTQMTGPRTDVSQVWNFTYDSAGHLTSIKDPLAHVTQYTAYDAYGHALTTVDPNGVVSHFTYDARGRLVTHGVAGRTWTYQRDAVGQIVGISYPNGASTTFTYDAAHRLTDAHYSLGAHMHRTLTAAGDIPSIQLLDATNTVVRQQSFSTDGLGRIASSTDANGQTQSFGYDLNGNLVGSVDALGRSSSATYDALNRPFSVTDALGNVSSTQFNLYNQPTQVTGPNGSVTQYSYDAFREVLQETSPDRGISTVTYTAAGLPATGTDARGVVVKFSFDALNRPTSISYNNAASTGWPVWIQGLGSSILSDNVSFNYDQGTGCANGVGRLCARTDQGGTERYAYDAFGDITQQTHVILGYSYSTQYAYDAASELTQEIYPDGRVINYARDGLERISAVQSTVNRAAASILSALQYRADGSAAGLTFGNGLTESRSYDPVGRLISQVIGSADSRSYGFDAVGNLTSKQTRAEADQFVYDANNRLDSEQLTQGTVSNSDAFSYDGNGNRLSSAQNGVVVPVSYTPDSNRLTQIGNTAVAVDAAGDTTADSGGARKFYFGAAGHLQWVSLNNFPNAAYLYNGIGQRTAKLTLLGISLYHYDIFGRLISETTIGSQPSRDYVWSGSVPVAQINHWLPIGAMVKLAHCLPGSDGMIDWVTYLHTDGLGTPRIGTDLSQNVVWRWDGEAFGQTLPNQAVPAGAFPVVVNLRYPGQYFDQETGLFYNAARYYNPQTGRYISSDPVGLGGGLNTYAYVGGNPEDVSDPAGKFGIVTAVIGGVIGGIVNAGVTSGDENISGGAAFLAGFAGGFVGGFFDSPALAGVISGAITAGITSNATAGSTETTVIQNVVLGGLLGGVSGLAGGGLSGALGASEVEAFFVGTTTAILGGDVGLVVSPGLINSASAAESSGSRAVCP